MAETYSVVVTGDILDGFDLGQVKANVGKLFKLSDEKIEKLFAGKPVAIQRGVDKEKAIKVRSALTKAGAASVVKLNKSIKAKAETEQAKVAQPSAIKKPIRAASVAQKPAEKVSEPVKAVKTAEQPTTSDGGENIECPRCGHDQPFVTACGKCKMNLSLHIQRLQRKAKVQALRRG